ncbi:MAG: outer membrane beta-barrel protein [Gemmatimonadetes bacterium]|nr:outer membrane beta-barrel protein [Gemmatimonadota bacterium]
MRKSLLLALTLSFVYVGTAQAQAIFDRAWGAKAGVSVSSASLDAIDETFSKSNQTGFAGGLFMHNYWGLFGGQLEASYVQKGVKGTSSSSIGDESTKLDYIELAALLKLGLPLGIVRPGLFGGIGFDILVSCDAGGDDCKDQSKSTDWVGIIGGDVIVYFGSFSVFGDGRYNIGLSEVTDVADFSYKNQGWTFQAGVGFQIG